MALNENDAVLPVFIFDSHILAMLEDRADARITFIHDEVIQLKRQLEAMGSTLLILYGEPVEVIRGLTKKYQVSSVYANHDYEPYARERDSRLSKYLESIGARFNTYKDQVIFEKDDILKDNGQPYTVFTAYSKRWKAMLTPDCFEEFDCKIYHHRFFQTSPVLGLSLEEIGFTRSGALFPLKKIDVALIQTYHTTRDFPALRGTTRLGLHLRFGTVSIRKLARIASTANETYLNELIWREFYMMILWHFPHVVNGSFKPEYDHIQWRNDEKEFRAWCEGRTGYPIVDAGMRELNSTGYMHNRMRMMTASFLTKMLLIDWRWGEAYFAGKLLDYELSSNNGGWQWSAGTGCDAAPYFRIFSPDSQTRKFDPELKYIRKWIPETGTEQYPKPVVDYRDARERALRTYKIGLRNSFEF
jgi:deoxyribodipyrimidine photo-lyase